MRISRHHFHARRGRCLKKKIPASRAPETLLSRRPLRGARHTAPARSCTMASRLIANLIVTGGQVTASMALITIEEDLASSVVLALLFILVFVTVLFRSLKMGVIALAPNALPVVATLAAMGAFDVPLRLATVLVFPMAIGVAVDASIHLLSRFRHEQQGAADVDDALRETVDGAGRPVVVSTMLLLCGFLMLGLSHFQAMHDFAVLSGATMTSALLVDLWLLPALMSKFLSPGSRAVPHSKEG